MHTKLPNKLNTRESLHTTAIIQFCLATKWLNIKVFGCGPTNSVTQKVRCINGLQSKYVFFHHENMPI